ncbi:hypothetical protein [Brachyspira sp.]|nr:hypothetical protein [Brachyspira sp.]
MTKQSFIRVISHCKIGVQWASPIMIPAGALIVVDPAKTAMAIAYGDS